jgi:hypothetical protein
MKKSLEVLGGLLVLGGAAGIVHRLVGWAPFGIIVRAVRATPFVRSHEVVTYVALMALGVVVVAVSGSVGEPRDSGEPQERA